MTDPADAARPARTLVALTRDVSPRLEHCELTHLARKPIDLPLARAQHLAYQQCLARLGCQVHRVAPAPDLPDSVFIEDTAVVLDALAVVTRPGAPSRRPEIRAVAVALAGFRPLAAIEAPGTLDGGDVLVLQDQPIIYAGRSTRTNAEGVAQLARHVESSGYTVRTVEVGGCLHLKTAVTQIADGTLLYNPEWVRAAAFAGVDLMPVDRSEPFAANALRVGRAVVHAAAWRRTRDRMLRSGIDVVPVELSELAKAEAGVTCCSLLFPRAPGPVGSPTDRPEDGTAP